MPFLMLFAASALYLTSRSLRFHDRRVRRLRRQLNLSSSVHVDHMRAWRVLDQAEMERMRLLVFEPLE